MVNMFYMISIPLILAVAFAWFIQIAIILFTDLYVH